MSFNEVETLKRLKGSEVLNRFARSDVQRCSTKDIVPKLKLTMQLLLIIYLKTKGMKQIDWKSVMLYIIRIIEMLLTGAAGGALVTNL